MLRKTRPEDEFALACRALRCCQLFREWPDIVVDRVAQIGHLKRYVRGAHVLGRDRARREVLVVASGCLEVSGTHASGKKFVLALQGPGEVTGLIRLHDDAAPPVYDFHAHEDTVLVHLPSDELRAVLDQTPMVWRDVALFALKRQRESIAMLECSALAELQQRVAAALVKLVDWRGSPVDQGPVIKLRVSQSDLAAMLMVSRQTMNKELRLLTQSRTISVEYGQITILDLPALEYMSSATLGKPRSIVSGFSNREKIRQ